MGQLTLFGRRPIGKEYSAEQNCQQQPHISEVAGICDNKNEGSRSLEITEKVISQLFSVSSFRSGFRTSATTHSSSDNTQNCIELCFFLRKTTQISRRRQNFELMSGLKCNRETTQKCKHRELMNRRFLTLCDQPTDWKGLAEKKTFLFVYLFLGVKFPSFVNKWTDKYLVTKHCNTLKTWLETICWQA